MLHLPASLYDDTLLRPGNSVALPSASPPTIYFQIVSSTSRRTAETAIYRSPGVFGGAGAAIVGQVRVLCACDDFGKIAARNVN